MPKKQDRSRLYLRGLPSGLLGRVNAAAELLDMERDKWVIQVLERETSVLEQPQQRLRNEHQPKTK